MSLNISMKALLESGVHFGHRTNRWDPRMKEYIFTERNGIHIVDLQQTVQRLEEAYSLICDRVAEGSTILLVGTKRQAQETILIEAERCGMPYVVERWLPGTLTNWSTIHARIMELERLEKMRDSGEIERLVKKEQLTIERQINRLLVHLSGIRHMNGLPDLIFIVDVSREYTAVHEANLKGVPVIAMVDTNCDPTNIDYLIPSNDDAIRAIKLMVGKVADAVLEGKALRKEEEMEEGYEPIGEDEGRERVRGRVALEEEVDDKELLGAAILQKLAESRQEAEAELAAVEEDAGEEKSKELETEEEVDEAEQPKLILEEEDAGEEKSKELETEEEVDKAEQPKLLLEEEDAEGEESEDLATEKEIEEIEEEERPKPKRGKRAKSAEDSDEDEDEQN